MEDGYLADDYLNNKFDKAGAFQIDEDKRVERESFVKNNENFPKEISSLVLSRVNNVGGRPKREEFNADIAILGHSNFHLEFEKKLADGKKLTAKFIGNDSLENDGLTTKNIMATLLRDPECLTEIGIYTGTNNFRNFDEKPSQAPSDLSFVALVAMREYLNKESSVVNTIKFGGVSSLSFGGPVVCAAWRRLLGWNICRIDNTKIQFVQKEGVCDEDLGVFHDIGESNVEFCEGRADSVRPWKLKGKGISLFTGRGIDFERDDIGFFNHLIVSYLQSDSENSNLFHINFNGTNAQGTWGGINLFTQKYEKYFDLCHEYVQTNGFSGTNAGFQLIFCFNTFKLVKVNEDSEKKVGDEIADIVFAPLGINYTPLIS